MSYPLRFSIALAIVLALSSSVAPARAASSAESKERADRAMDEGRFEAALTQYREAFAAEPSPVLLYNIGRAEERLGRYAEALTTLTAFDASASPDLKAKVPRLGTLVGELRRRVVELSVHSNVDGARVYLGTDSIGTTPLSSPVFVMPGATELKVLADGYAPYTREVSLDAGRRVVVDVSLVPARAAIASSPSGGSVVGKWWFWTGVGVVVLGGAAITVAALSSHPAPQGDIEPRQVTAPLLRF